MSLCAILVISTITMLNPFTTFYGPDTTESVALAIDPIYMYVCFCHFNTHHTDWTRPTQAKQSRDCQVQFFLSFSSSDLLNCLWHFDVVWFGVTAPHCIHGVHIYIRSLSVVKLHTAMTGGPALDFHYLFVLKLRLDI